MTEQPKQPWLVAAAIGLQLVLLAAAFTLGITVGRNSIDRWAVNSADDFRGPGHPGDSLPSGVRPDEQPLPPGLEEAPQLIGRIVRISPDALELAAPRGPRTVLTDAATIYETFDSDVLSAADVHPDMIVAIYGPLDPPSGDLVASRVVVLPPQQPQP